jgi:hypothetical protein
MTQEFIDRLFAAVIGKKTDAWGRVWHSVAHTWLYYPASKDGEATKEVRDWFAKEMPEWWEKYLDDMTRQYYWEDVTGISLLVKLLNAQLSITNLAQFIVDNYKEMFYEECPKCDGTRRMWIVIHPPLLPPGYGLAEGGVINNKVEFDRKEIDCTVCNGTGKIVKPQFAEAVKVIEEEEGKE